MNFLFWNINRKNLSENIFNISQNHEIDVIILAESEIKPVELLLTLNQDKVEFFVPNPISQFDKVKIYTKFNSKYIEPLLTGERYEVSLLEPPVSKPVLLTTIHFIDKSSHSDESQNEDATIISREIKELEKSLGIQSNIIVGDFNMNPFEKGLVKTTGFHATMSKDIALENSRIVQGKAYEYYYNPMWNLLGDLQKPVGTYYYRKAEHLNYQWNIFDQVLISPDLICRFNLEKLVILETDGINSLVNDKNRPNKNIYSDHLPIIFSIDLNLENYE